jgi:hypothetical protein
MMCSGYCVLFVYEQLWSRVSTSAYIITSGMGFDTDKPPEYWGIGIRYPLNPFIHVLNYSGSFKIYILSSCRGTFGKVIDQIIGLEWKIKRSE